MEIGSRKPKTKFEEFCFDCKEEYDYRGKYFVNILLALSCVAGGIYIFNKKFSPYYLLMPVAVLLFQLSYVYYRHKKYIYYTQDTHRLIATRDLRDQIKESTKDIKNHLDELKKGIEKNEMRINFLLPQDFLTDLQQTEIEDEIDAVEIYRDIP